MRSAVVVMFSSGRRSRRMMNQPMIRISASTAKPDDDERPREHDHRPVDAAHRRGRKTAVTRDRSAGRCEAAADHDRPVVRGCRRSTAARRSVFAAGSLDRLRGCPATDPGPRRCRTARAPVRCAGRVVQDQREASAGRIVCAGRDRRRRDFAGRRTAQVVVELLDEAALRQDDDDRARNDERGREQDPERQQQPRSERQAQACQAASARSV